MALFHFHVTQVKRSNGQSAITSAAYRAGEKLYSEYYGEVSDYTRKGGVICADIFLPPQAPQEYRDRETLWNAVEQAERSKKAQLAYSFDVAMQNEFTMEENIALARRFIVEQFVSRGMVVDFFVHAPDKKKGGIPNPHFHILAPIRPIQENGKWGCKQHRVYCLDENGDRILGEDGKPKFNAVPTTDWGTPETLEAWRAAWAEMVNAKFVEKGLPCRIDHRSYIRQGLDLLPTVHEGPAVRQMEAKGIPTDKGELNRWIKATNALMKDVKKKIAALLDWLRNAKEELNKPKVPNLAELLSAYYNARNAGAWSQKAKVSNLKDFAHAVDYLTEHELFTLEDLENYVTTQNDKVDALRESMKSKSAKMKELKELIQLVGEYRERKPVYDQMNAIHWKGKRQKFQDEHEGELRLFYAARRKLEKHFSSEGKLPVGAWKKELEALQREHEVEYAAFKPLRDDLMKLLQVKNCVETVIKHQEQTPREKQNMER